jgi:hemoglobin/transferrin/lactoferrin receptor protein
VQINPAADHETYGGRLQATFEAGDHTIVTGADFWTWDVSSRRVRHLMFAAPPDRYLIDSPTPDARQISVGIFAEDDWKLGRDFTLNIGGRLDYLRTKNDPMYNVTPAGSTRLYGAGTESDLGWHLHAGLTWKLNEAWSQSFLLASSYRAADVMERFKYITLGGVPLYGNPELDPEQSFYAEYGLHYASKPFKTDLRVFANIVTDYIAEKRVDASRIDLDNVDDARIYGAELEMRWDFHENWGTYGSVTALYGRDEEKNQALPGVAPVSGRIGVDFKNSGFWARLESDMIAPQRSVPSDQGPGVPDINDTKGVILLNAALGYTFTTMALKHDISLTLDNLLDTRYYNYLAHQRGNTVWEPGFAAMINYSVEF